MPLTTFTDQFNNLLDPAHLNNVAPIFHKPIDQHTGITISGKFKTSDNTLKGEMSYITVARNPVVFHAHDGFGIAWRKQHKYLKEIHDLYTASGASASLSVTSPARIWFNETYGHLFNVSASFSGLTDAWEKWLLEVTGNDIYENKTRNPISTDTQLLKYNVYLVDTDILQEEVWVNAEAMWDQTGGKNQFLQAAKVWITDGEWYEFNMKIYEKLGFEAWIWNSASPPESPLSPDKRILNRGQTYPPYVAKARYWGTADIERLGYMDGLAGGHFGVAVGNTRNNEWYYDNLHITSFAETFPMHLFSFKPSLNDFPSSGPITATYYGVGYDKTLYAYDGSGHSQTRAWIWNTTLNKWEILGQHNSEIGDARALQKISKTLTPLRNYLDGDSKIHLLAHAANSGPKPGLQYDIESGTYKQSTAYNPVTNKEEVVTKDFSNDSNHHLTSYYASINNTDIEGLHRGNSIDTYIFDPDNIVQATSEVTMVEDVLYTSTIPSFPGFITEFLEIRQKISQTVLDKSTYTITNAKKGGAYSSGPTSNYKIQFIDTNLSGTRLELVYRYWSGGNALQTFLTSDDYRSPGADLLVKAMPVFCVTISDLVYSDGPLPIIMREAVAEYINKTLSQTLEKSGIINFLYSQGATSVNTDFTMTVKEYSTEFVPKNISVDQKYVIPSTALGELYSNFTKLSGITQQGTGAQPASTTNTNTSLSQNSSQGASY